MTEVERQREGNKLERPLYAKLNEARLRTLARIMALERTDADGKQGSRAPTSILDVGCRTGEGAAVLQALFQKAVVVGVDLVPDFVAEAQKKYPKVKFEVADAVDLPFGFQAFDWVIVSHVLEHCQNFGMATSEAKRVCRWRMAVALPLGPEPNPCEYHAHSTVRGWLTYRDHGFGLLGTGEAAMDLLALWRDPAGVVMVLDA